MAHSPVRFKLLAWCLVVSCTGTAVAGEFPQQTGKAVLRAQSPGDSDGYGADSGVTSVHASSRTMVSEPVLVHEAGCGCLYCLPTEDDDSTFFGRLKIKSREMRRKVYLWSRNKNRYFLNPVCSPLCAPNFGYYRTRWRTFPELPCNDPGIPPEPEPAPMSPVSAGTVFEFSDAAFFDPGSGEE